MNNKICELCVSFVGKKRQQHRRKVLESIRTKNNGFTKLGLQSIGVEYPVTTGWQKRFIYSQSVSHNYLVTSDEPIKQRKSMSKELRMKIYAENAGMCAICCNFIVEIKHMHIDHIVPWSKGGTDHINNLRPTHSKCNLEKKDKLPSSQDIQFQVAIRHLQAIIYGASK